MFKAYSQLWRGIQFGNESKPLARSLLSKISGRLPSCHGVSLFPPHLSCSHIHPISAAHPSRWVPWSLLGVGLLLQSVGPLQLRAPPSSVTHFRPSPPETLPLLSTRLTPFLDSNPSKQVPLKKVDSGPHPWVPSRPRPSGDSHAYPGLPWALDPPTTFLT